MSIEETLARLAEEYEVPAEVLEPLKGSTLRKQLEDTQASLREKDTALEQATTKISSYEKTPRREALAKELGVDLSTLPKAQREIAKQFDPDVEDAKEAFATFMNEWEIAAVAPEGTPPAAGIVNQAQTPPVISTPPDIDVRIAEAEAAGDIQTSIVLKAQKAQATSIYR